MARKSVAGATYPANWKAIATAVKDEHDWTCIRCGAKHDPPRVVMTVHHLDMNPSNNVWWNLLCLCARCHLSVQGRVVLERPWVMQEHSGWFRPYVAAYYAERYLGERLTREQVMRRLPELLSIERLVVLGNTSF